MGTHCRRCCQYSPYIPLSSLTFVHTGLCSISRHLLSKGFALAARTNPLCPLTQRAGNAHPRPPPHLMTNVCGAGREICQHHHSLAKIILRCVLYHRLERPCGSKGQLVPGFTRPAGCLPFPEPPPHSLTSGPAPPKSMLYVHQPLSPGVLLGRTNF